MQPGDRVNWQYTQRGYAFVVPVAAIVRAVTPSRVKIEVARKVSGKWQMEVKTVSPEKLSPRRTVCEALGESV